MEVNNVKDKKNHIVPLDSHNYQNGSRFAVYCRVIEHVGGRAR